MIGKIIREQYKIIDLLGGGGFGRAYLAHDIKSSGDIWYVVKQLQPSIDPLKPINWETAKRLFSTEAETLKFLGENDRIPKLFDFFEEDKQLYLVEEFIEGYELSEELSNGNLDEQQIYFLLIDILEILKFIQENNVIHRDITPDNLIKRRQDNKLVLIDFGAVKQVLIDNTGKPKRSKTIVIGKEDYMPDEQANGRPGFYSDVYAVGIIGIQAFIGSVPSKDYDSGEIIWRNHAHISCEFANIIDKMTKCYFKDRYQSASEVLNDLNSLSSYFINRENTPSKYFRYSYTQKWYIRANILKNRKHHEEAILLYKKVIEIRPTHFRAIFNIGIAYSYLKLYDLAIDTYNTLLDIKPNATEVVLHKGIIFYKSSHYDEALECFDLVINSQSNQAVAWYYKMLTFQQLNNEQEASNCYQELIQLRLNYKKI
ncbi:protein kinase domain-containing protein [Tolypothrix sp. VBCCA 56010]|uniref:protein kinase domain-containing protein n=1 Tax=Tolypothrix sp. VBCCA 56010 TaxID=3137731 RepID=UPI003D7D41D6